MTREQADFWASYRYAIACKRAELEAGHKMTPREMAERVKPEQSA